MVGIYNTGDERIHEYTPTKDAKLGGGLADDYGRMHHRGTEAADRSHLPDAA